MSNKSGFSWFSFINKIEEEQKTVNPNLSTLDNQPLDKWVSVINRKL